MTGDLQEILESELGEWKSKRDRLITLVAAVEDLLAMPRTIPCELIPRRPAPRTGEITQEERQTWQDRRRAWMMEITAIERFHDLPRVFPPKDVREKHRRPDPRHRRPV